jgi:probable HAF family extracellular repeat protein
VYRGTTITQSGLSLRTVRPFGVNEDGVVVGEAAISASPNALYAFKEDPAVPNGSSPPFADGPGKRLVDPTSAALGINASGQIVGQNNLSQAYRYTPGAPASFVTLSAPSTATAINDAGNFVGVREISGQERAFLYDGTVHDLLPAVQAASEASAINNDGDVAGSIAMPRGGGGNVKSEAFLLRSGAGAHEDLGVAEGYDESLARGININEWVVGEATGTGQDRTAWLWVDGQLFDLSTQLEWDWWEEGDTTPGFERLLTANAVNDDGLIVGQGQYRVVKGSTWVTENRAFVLGVTGVPQAISEPGTLVLLLTGLAAICTVAMRRIGAH